jgi:hypothetical protein
MTTRKPKTSAAPTAAAPPSPLPAFPNPPNDSCFSLLIGKNVFIRTVTHHYTGRLVAVYPTELVLTDAAWIADDGRFHEVFLSGEFSEVEPYADDLLVVVSRLALCDACEFKFKLPRKTK